MTIPEYWTKELRIVHDLVMEQDESLDNSIEAPQFMGALIIARQLRDLTTALDQIRAQLRQIEDQLSQ